MLSKEQLDKLTKPELVKYVLSLQDVKDSLRKLDETLTNRLDSIEGKLLAFEEFKSTTTNKIEQLEGELAVSKNASELLKEELERKNDDVDKKIKVLERATYRSAEYANYETLEISNIPISIPNPEVPNVVLSVINALDQSSEDFHLGDVHAIHRRQGLFTKEKVLVKFVRRGDAFYTLSKAKTLRTMNLLSIDERLTKPIFINEHLSPYYGKLRYACKLMKEQKLINDFWVSGHKVKVKTLNDDIEIISHNSDLIKVTDQNIVEILSKCKF